MPSSEDITPGLRQDLLGNMKNRFNEEKNGGKSRGVVMIYSSCVPGKTYGVVLIFFLWVVETIWSSEPNKLVSIQALVASYNLFLREINNHHVDKKRPMIRKDWLILVRI